MLAKTTNAMLPFSMRMTASVIPGIRVNRVVCMACLLCIVFSNALACARVACPGRAVLAPWGERSRDAGPVP